MAAAMLLMAGCDAAPRPATSESTSAESAGLRVAEVLPTQADPRDGARPDLSQLSYDPAGRRLHVYPLTERGARWLLVLPGFPMGVPLEGEFVFPTAMDCDLDQVQLFIIAPNRRAGTPVTLRDILESGTTAQR